MAAHWTLPHSKPTTPQEIARAAYQKGLPFFTWDRLRRAADDIARLSKLHPGHQKGKTECKADAFSPDGVVAVPHYPSQPWEDEPGIAM